MKFLCGCMSQLELPIPFDLEIEGKTKEAQQFEYLSTFDSVGLDDEGFLICKLHHERRYGWRVPNHTSRYAGLTDKQYEELIVWSNAPAEVEFMVLKSSAVDLRPHIYEGMLDEKARAVLARVRNSDVRGPSISQQTSNAHVNDYSTFRHGELQHRQAE